MGDPLVEGSRRWNVLWVHYEAEELRIHHRATIPSDETRAVVMTLLSISASFGRYDSSRRAE